MKSPVLQLQALRKVGAAKMKVFTVWGNRNRLGSVDMGGEGIQHRELKKKVCCIFFEIFLGTQKRWRLYVLIITIIIKTQEFLRKLRGGRYTRHTLGYLLAINGTRSTPGTYRQLLAQTLKKAKDVHCTSWPQPQWWWPGDGISAHFLKPKSGDLQIIEKMVHNFTIRDFVFFGARWTWSEVHGPSWPAGPTRCQMQTTPLTAREPWRIEI